MTLSALVKQRALEIGFDLVGIAPLAVWEDLAFSRRWVEQGFGGEMRYLENPKRHDPRQVLPSARSVVCVGLVYNAPLPYSTEVSGQSQKSEDNGPRTTDTRAKARVLGYPATPGAETTTASCATDLNDFARPSRRPCPASRRAST